MDGDSGLPCAPPGRTFAGAASDGLVHPLVLSLSKDEPFCSWFDTLTTSGHISIVART